MIRRLLAWLWDRWDDDPEWTGDVEAEWARLWEDE